MSDEARKFKVRVEVEVDVVVNDPDVFERITGPNGDEWRSHLYPLRTEKDVLEMLAGNAVCNGVDAANRLEGWADLDSEAATMRVGYAALADYNPVAAESRS